MNLSLQNVNSKIWICRDLCGDFVYGFNDMCDEELV